MESGIRGKARDVDDERMGSAKTIDWFDRHMGGRATGQPYPHVSTFSRA